MSVNSIYVEEHPAPSRPALDESPQHEFTRPLVGLLSLAEGAAAGMAISHPDDTLQQVIARPTLRQLLSAMRCRDNGTMQHCRRVAALAVGLSKNLGWDREDQKVLEVACLLHDVGKVGIPDNILFKPGRLNADELAQMQLHTNLGLGVLQACGADIRVVEFIAQASLVEQEHAMRSQDVSEVHLGARILAVADAYDALCTDQVYREGRPHAEILDILMKQWGTRFDGNVICALARWIERDGLPDALNAGVVESTESASTSDSREALEATMLTDTLSQLYRLEHRFDGYYVMNSNREIVVWSRGLERLMERPARNVLGRCWEPGLFAYAGELGQPLAESEIPIVQALQSKNAQTGALRVQQSPDVWLNVELQTVPLHDEQGRVLGVAEIFKDLQQTANLPADYQELKLAASRDALTQVANRGELETQLNLLFDDWHDSQEAEPFSVIFLDVDFFKNINDTFGHTVGDQVLIDLARLLRQESFSGELVGRYGGEEFVVLCPSSTLNQGIRRAERLRETLQSTKIGGISNYRVIASFGVAQVMSDDSPQTLLNRADKGLYQAKQTGRNKTVALTSEEAEGNVRSNPDVDAEDPFVLKTEFEACLGADMIVYKLGGLVRDENAKLGAVEKDKVELRFGSAGLFRFWGGSGNRQPVKVTIELSATDRARAGKYTAASKSMVTFTVQPVGIIRKADVFQKRAREVIKTIRAYLQAG